MEHAEGLSPKEARSLLGRLLGHSVPNHEFFNLVTRGMLSPIPGTHPRHFREQDVRAIASRVKKIEIAQHEAQGTLGTQDALAYLRARGIKIERGKFRATLSRLQAERKVAPPTVIPYVSRPHYRFLPESLDVVAQELKNDAIEGLLPTGQAAAYLSGKHKRAIPTDLIYHKVRRGTLVPDVTTEDGHYYFSRETLDKIDVGTQRQVRKVAEPIIDIRYISQIREMEEKMGIELLTGEGVLKLLHQRAGRTYTPEAIKQMRRRGTLHPVAHIGKKLLYNKADVERIRVLPKTGRNMGRARETHDPPSPTAIAI